MKPGFKFFSFSSSVAALLCCSWCVFLECGAVRGGSSFATEQIAGVVGVFSTILAGSHYASAMPPSLFRKRLGSPMPQIGRPISLDDEEDSDEDDEELLNDQSLPRQDPHITPLNRDQCLAKLLCGMSVPVTGGSSKKNYYSEYANIVSKFFEAFPPDDELQSKESIETYDDYSNEDDGKPIRMNNRRKPLNSSRVDATAPSLQLFDLALVDIAKPEDIAKNRTRKAAFEKVSTGNRIARARRIVENLGQKLQTVRQCQSISGCPFSFKQLREKIKSKEAQRISSNVQLPPGPPVWSANPKRQNEPTQPSFQQKPYIKPQSRPRPLPPNPKPNSQSGELFSNEEPVFPFKDTNKGDDEIEELFGPPPVSKKPLGFHQGVDENFNYDYNPDKPWRPGSTGGNSYSHRPWNRPRPQQRPFSRPSGGNNEGQQRLPQKPRPRPVGNSPPANQKRYPPQQNQQKQQQHQNQQKQQQQQQQQNRRPATNPAPPPPKPKKPTQPPTTTARSPFPKKKISYLNSPYSKPSTGSGEDDEGSEDINKVAPVELVGNSDAGENEQVFAKVTKPDEDEETDSPKYTIRNKKKNNDDDDYSYEYDDDYDDDYEDNEEVLDDEDEEEDDYSDEEDDKESEAKKKKQKQKEKRKKNKQKKKKVKEEAAASVVKKTKINANPNFDDENADIDEIWTKLNYATTGANYKAPEKLKKKEDSRTAGESDDVAATALSEEDDDDDDDDEDEEEEDEEARKSTSGLQKTRTSSSSASNEEDADDEVDDENQSKPKRKKSKNKVKADSEKQQQNDEQVAADIVKAAPESGKKEKDTGKKTKKNKKTKKKPAKKTSSEEEEELAAARRKQVMMEIGGRPLVPKPESDQVNSQKTSSLISNRFKFQFINPYGPAPPSDVNLPGAYTPLRTSYVPTQAPSGGSAGSAMSSLPFKFNINPGALGNFVGGASGGMAGYPSMGSSSSASGSLEMPDPHHPPPSNGYIPPPPQMQPHQQRQEHFPHSPNLSGGSLGGSSLFKFQNPLPALSNLFKRPSAASFDPMLSGPEGHGPPPVSAFIHRPVGPESSHYKRERPSPASGSSSPARSSITSSDISAGGAKKKSSKSKASKGKKGKL